MGFIHEKQKILREIVKQRIRRRAGRSAGKHARVVFNARAESDLAEHFHIVFCAFGNSLRLNELALRLKFRHAIEHFAFDLADGGFPLFIGGRIVRGGIDRGVAQRADHLTRDDVDLANAVDLVTEKFHADGVLSVGGHNVENVTANTEFVSLQGNIVSRVLDGDQAKRKLLHRHLHTGTKRKHQFLIFHRVTERINTGHAGHDDNVTAFKERRGRAVTESVDLIVDRGILFNIKVFAGDICLRLIIIVIGHEIFYGIIGEKFTEFRAKLCRKRFIVRKHERRTVAFCDNICHSEGLARARYTHESLCAVTAQNAPCQSVDGFGLIARRLIG